MTMNTKVVNHIHLPGLIDRLSIGCGHVNSIYLMSSMLSKTISHSMVEHLCCNNRDCLWHEFNLSSMVTYIIGMSTYSTGVKNVYASK